MNLQLRTDDRGIAAGAAAVLLAVFVYLLLVRFDEKWGPGIDLLISGAAAAALLALALRLTDADRPAGGTAAAGEAGRAGGVVAPRGWVSAMLVAAFALTALALFSLADILGANTDDLDSSTITWIALVLAVGFAGLSLRTGSAICTFLAAVAAVVGVTAAVDWIFSPEAATTFRWVLLILAVVLAAAGVALRDERPRHGTVLVAAAGLTILGIALSYTGELFIVGEGEAGENASTWWELVVLAGGVGLAAYAILTREPGPGYIAAAVLASFVLIARSSGDEPSIIGWPIVLLVLTALAAAAAFRPGDDRGAATTPPRDGPGESAHEVRL